jgi:Prenyltransferase and squalene oxidase repeat
VSWQLGAFGVLAIGLAGGFAWYERTKPDARIVALVGVLAAFAALGRIAFAALPNVKPTTDIVLVSGYALGGAPGFVVGALAGLTSNFFFGQGPWTPWQMAAWGATGIVGALLARATRGRIGRWPLAIVCAASGYAFAAVQDGGDWVTYSDHSVAQLGVYVGKGTGFDLVHATGCLLFALAFGPALTRSIRRFAARLHVEWRPVGAVTSTVAMAVALTLALSTLLAWPADQPGIGGGGDAAAAGTPTGYLLSAQNSDGGYGGAPGQSSSSLFSGWAALGLASAGHNPSGVRRGGGASLLDYVRTAPGSDPGSLERTILALRASGASAGSQVSALDHDFRGDGSISDQVNLTAFAVLALRAAGASVPPPTLGWLAHQQDSDGGFNFATAGGSSDVDDTGAALEALGANGRAVAFIRREQNSDGGFPSMPGGASNAQSTAWAVQGLLAAGAGLGSLPHGSPLGYLQSLIAPDGHVQYSRSSDQTPVWVTAEALMALEQKPLPLAAPAAPAAGRGRRRAAGRHASTHRRRHSRRRLHASRTPPLIQGLAVDAGVATAVLLAPVGG